MRTFIIIFLITITSLSYAAYADNNLIELSPAAQLRKLSLSLRGSLPTMEEFEEINQLPLEKVQSFLSQKTKQYMNKKAYQEKMQQRLQELFRLKISNKVKIKKILSTYESENLLNETSFNSLDQIFLNIIKNNLSWDQLLQRKTYQIFDQDYGNLNLIRLFPNLVV